VPWYASNGCDELMVESFVFRPRFEHSTGTIEFLSLFEARNLDDIELAQDGLLSPAEEDESTLVFFCSTDTEPEHGSSSDSDYQSADEDIPRPQWRDSLRPAKVYSTQSHAVIRGNDLLDGLSQYSSANPQSSKNRRIWQGYAAMLETGDLESWTSRYRINFDHGAASYGYLIGSQWKLVAQ